MKKTVLTTLAIALPLLAVSTSSLAFGGHHGGKGERCGGDVRHMLRQLDLTDEQKTELKSMRESFKEDRKAMRDEAFSQRGEYRDDMQSLMLAADFDEAQAQALVAQMTEQHQAKRVERLAKQHQMLSILDETQKAELQGLWDEAAEKCEAKRERKASRG